ncbi:hypothetical protein L6452_17030 [Arctium lappa]|uniref:Uncharacterized protein n=1 Tax=Arctium lappa TaxID=4217 RepID=A0ACB9C2E0_ARCLA|nr:hypothetical protein L6452_17030 [Arctium lappa]
MLHINQDDGFRDFFIHKISSLYLKRIVLILLLLQSDFDLSHYSYICNEDQVAGPWLSAAYGGTVEEQVNGCSFIWMEKEQMVGELKLNIIFLSRHPSGKVLSLFFKWLGLEKDVDGFHSMNMGSLAVRGREPLFIPCTPKGCVELLIRSGKCIW